MYPHPPGQRGAQPQYSPDGRWWWDGQRWLPAEQRPAAPRPGGMGTGVKVILVGSGAFVALVLLIGVVVAAVLLAPRPGGRPALVSRPGVVFDDDFSANRGWDVTPVEGFTTDIHVGHPGAMHMAVTKKDAGFHELYPGASYSRVRFTATIANNTGAGDVGLICDDPNSSGRYRFWAGSSGTAFIDFSRGLGTTPMILAQTDVRGWGQGEKHTMTAVCSSDGTYVSLQLLVDGKSVLQASDTTLTGPFRAGILVLGPFDFDLQRFAVTTL